MKRGLYLGRFQPFHNGHLDAVKIGIENSDELVIMIGSAQHSFTKYNPFTCTERFEMIERALKYEGISGDRYHIIPIKDINNNALWVPEVELNSPKFEIVFAGNDLTKSLFAHKGYQIYDLVHQGMGTKIRDMIANDGDWKNEVPKGTLEVMLEINGTKRIKELYEARQNA